MSGSSLGWPRVHLRRTDSTNERARELAHAGAAHGTLVTATEQTAGRGRQGRTWVAPAGRSLLMSLILRELEELLPLAAAVAVCEACEEAAGVECRVKWPNDVWIEGRKVAGILIEGRPQEGWAVLGIGVNVGTLPEELPEELRGVATSLGIASGGDPPAVEEVLDRLLRGLERGLGAAPDAVLAAWRARDALCGREVRWADGAGVAAGISESGALLVDTSGGRVELDAGEVHLLR